LSDIDKADNTSIKTGSSEHKYKVSVKVYCNETANWNYNSFCA